MTRRGFFAIVSAALITPTSVTAGTKITLKGRLFRFHPDSDALDYALDPTGDTEGIELRPNDGGYLNDYMRGCEGRIVAVTIEPQPEEH